jgi:TetR/AcrR family acrAB operon transcriptional repressor
MGAPASKKQIQTELTRERLLEAATRVFAERGYSDGSVKEIADLAGTSQGTIFWHFGSKEGLVIAVVDRAFLVWEREVLAPLLARDLPTAGIRPAIEAHLAFARRDPAIGQRLFLTLASGALAGNEELRVAYARIYDRLRSYGREWIGRAVERGTCRADLDIDAVATTIVAALAGISLQWLIDPTAVGLESAHRDLARVLERGLSPVSARGPSSAANNGSR